MIRQGLTVLCCACVVVGLAACGSSSKSSGSKQLGLSQFITKADAICAAGNAQRSAIPQPNVNPATAGPAQLKLLADFLNKNSSSLASELQQIRALGTPKTGGPVVQAALALGDRSLAAETAAAQAAAKGDGPAFRAALAAAQKIGRPTMLTPLGFKVCGSPRG
jgi:hypothetical protein